MARRRINRIILEKIDVLDDRKLKAFLTEVIDHELSNLENSKTRYKDEYLDLLDRVVRST